MGDVERVRREDLVEEVVESLFQDVRRANVGGKGLVVAGSRTMERLDGAGRVDSICARILQKPALISEAPRQVQDD